MGGAGGRRALSLTCHHFPPLTLAMRRVPTLSLATSTHENGASLRFGGGGKHENGASLRFGGGGKAREGTEGGEGALGAPSDGVARPGRASDGVSRPGRASDGVSRPGPARATARLRCKRLDK